MEIILIAALVAGILAD